MQPLNQVYNYQPKQQNAQTAPNNNTTGKTATREVKRRFEGNCSYCNILGHKWIECLKRLRDEANGNPKKTQQRPQTGNTNAQQQQTEKPQYNSKLVYQICGKVGHSARDCRDRVPSASAYRNNHMTSSLPMRIANSAVSSNNRRTTTSQPTKSRRRQTSIPKQKKTTTATIWITMMNSTRIQKTCNATSSSIQPNRKCATNNQLKLTTTRKLQRQDVGSVLTNRLNHRRNTMYTKSRQITTIYFLSLTTTPIVQRKAAFRKKTHLNHNEAKMPTRQEPKTHDASGMN